MPSCQHTYVGVGRESHNQRQDNFCPLFLQSLLYITRMHYYDIFIGVFFFLHFLTRRLPKTQHIIDI